MRTQQETPLQGEEAWQHVRPTRQAAQEDTTRDRQQVNERVAAQFGDVRSATTQGERVWWREDENGVRGLPKATAIAVGLTYTLNAVFSSSISYLLFMIPAFFLNRFGLAGIDVPEWLRAMFVTQYGINDTRPWWVHLLPALILTLPCVIAGAILARVVPRNAVRAAYRASIVLFVFGLANTLLSLLFMWRAFHGDYVVGLLIRVIFMPIILIAATWFFVRRQRLDR